MSLVFNVQEDQGQDEDEDVVQFLGNHESSRGQSDRQSCCLRGEILTRRA